MTWTETELAYAAGLVDGEGSLEIRLRANRHGVSYHSCQVSVSNTDLRMLLWLHERFDGIVTPPKRGRAAHHRPLHVWYLSTAQCGDFLAAVRPYLVIKREQADLILELRKLTGAGGRVSVENRVRREELRLELRALTKRGV